MSYTSAGTPLLAADELSLTRGGRELFSGLSVEVNAGEVWQVEGANGAGKTSLLKILAGLSRLGFEGQVKRSGELLYLGHLSAVKALLSPRENLTMHPSGVANYSSSDIEAALGAVGLFGYEDVASHTLSAGQHRRVNLARLYLSGAPLWILDEPFTAIDREGVTGIESQFMKHVQRGGSIIVSSHNQDCP